MKSILLILSLTFAMLFSMNASAITVNPMVNPNVDYACTMPFPPEEIVAVYFEYSSNNQVSWTMAGNTQNPSACQFTYDIESLPDGDYLMRSFYQYINREVSPYSELTPLTISRHVDLPAISDVVITPK